MAEKIKNLFYEIGYKVDDKGVKKAEKNTENLTGKVEDFIGTAVGVVAVGTAFKKAGEFIGSSVTQIAALDDATRIAGSKIGVTDEELQQLRDSAREVGLEFNTTGEEVAKAQNFLALAGFSLEDTIAATDDLVAVQKASGESMSTVADIVTDVSTAYKINADEIGRVGDMAVYTSSKFNTSVAQLGEAYKYVATSGKEAGVELSDLNAMLGVMANSGIKGSQAGTSLNMMFTKLKAPTKEASKLLKKYNIQLYDQEGNFKGVNNVLGQSEKALSKMTDKQKAYFKRIVLGEQGTRAFNIVTSEGVDKVNEFGNAIDESNGKAKEMADFIEGGLGGSVRGLKTEFSEIKNITGEIFEPVAADIYDGLTESLRKANEALRENKEENKDFITGMYETTKEAGKLMVDTTTGFVSNTAGILNFATGGLFTAPGDIIKPAAGEYFTGKGEQARLQREDPERETIEREFIERTRNGEATGGGMMRLPNLNSDLNLTINTGGAPLDRETATKVNNDFNNALDQWWNNKLETEMNGLGGN